MYSGKPQIRLWPLMMAAVLVLGSMVGVALGKYIHSTELEATVTFSAKLADSIVLEEHEAVRQSDGSYKLDNTKTVTSNAYTLIPGLDVPKDPYITIKNKTPLDAYLFVEVVDTLDVHTNTDDSTFAPVTYHMTDNWMLLKDGENPVAGKHGGTVYVYTADGTNAAAVNDEKWTAKETTEDGATNYYLTIPLLQADQAGNSVFVSQYLNKYDVTDTDTDVLEFYAAMGEIATAGEGDATRLRTPAEVYRDIIS